MTILYPFGKMESKTLTIDTEPTPNEVVYEISNSKTLLVIEETDTNYTLKLTPYKYLDAGAEVTFFLQAETANTVAVTLGGDLEEGTITLEDGAKGFYTYIYTGDEFVPISGNTGPQGIKGDTGDIGPTGPTGPASTTE